MPKTNARARRDFYSEITNRVIEALKTADPDRWTPPWITTGGDLPTNAETGNTYRGINILNLWIEASNQAFTTNRWGTFRQWQKIGGQVRKGETGTLIVFTKPIQIENEDNEPETRRVYRHSAVFNAAQVDGIDLEEIKYPDRAEAILEAEAFINATGAEIHHTGDRALFNRTKDQIHLPERAAFKTTEGYYSTAFHELTHWTGDPKRLDRDFGKRFGDNAYAAEELVAELGSHFLMSEFDMEATATRDTADYLAHWIQILQSDNRAIFTAASRASDAVDYLAKRGGAN